jgi:hypothetical protein
MQILHFSYICTFSLKTNPPHGPIGQPVTNLLFVLNLIAHHTFTNVGCFNASWATYMHSIFFLMSILILFCRVRLGFLTKLKAFPTFAISTVHSSSLSLLHSIKLSVLGETYKFEIFLDILYRNSRWNQLFNGTYMPCSQFVLLFPGECNIAGSSRETSLRVSEFMRPCRSSSG